MAVLGVSAFSKTRRKSSFMSDSAGHVAGMGFTPSRWDPHKADRGVRQRGHLEVHPARRGSDSVIIAVTQFLPSSHLPPSVNQKIGAAHHGGSEKRRGDAVSAPVILVASLDRLTWPESQPRRSNGG